MKKLFITSAFALALSTTTALAAITDVAGIQVVTQPDDILQINFESAGTSVEVGTVTTTFGYVTNVNTAPSALYCTVSPCELTYVFALDTADNSSTLQFYLGTGASYNYLSTFTPTLADANDGALWMTVTSTEISGASGTHGDIDGDSYATFYNIDAGNSDAAVVAYFDTDKVFGGVHASQYFTVANNGGNGADWFFTFDGIGAGGSTGQLINQTVSEPATLGLLGLGLVGMGAMARRRRS